MTTISKSDRRKVVFIDLEEGHALIAEHESYTLNGRRRWNKTVVSLTPDEIRKIMALIEEKTSAG